MKSIWKRLASGILAILTLTSVSAFAIDTKSTEDTTTSATPAPETISLDSLNIQRYSNDIDTSNSDIEVSVNDLEDGGITIAMYLDTNGQPVYKQVTETTVMPYATSVATFHVGLKTNSKGKKYLYWNASGPSISKVKAYIACKSTDLKTQYYGTSVNSSYSGVNFVQSATSSFSIPSKVTKVRVGWTSAAVTTSQGSFAIPTAFTTVKVS